ncbi:MAG: PHP domain-containing protein [Hornefia sp.]|nr:PHP domain-containing protein [Hornefia sp.]
MEIDLSRYRMTFDYHTHTLYSPGITRFTPHGKGTMEENVKAAISKGLDEIAISDHGPGHIFYGMKRRKIDEMRSEISRLRKKYPEIKIHFSVESNILFRKKGNCLDLKAEDMGNFDFILAGYHLGTAKSNMIGNWCDNHRLTFPNERRRLLRENTFMTLKALRENDIKILTHPGDKGLFDIELIARTCAERGTWMEINNSHKHMSIEEIKIAMKEPEVKFVIGSDAHCPEWVGTFEKALKRAFEAGLTVDRIVNIAER